MLVALAAIAVVTALVIAAWKVGGPSTARPGPRPDAGATTTAAKKHGRATGHGADRRSGRTRGDTSLQVYRRR